MEQKEFPSLAGKVRPVCHPRGACQTNPKKEAAAVTLGKCRPALLAAGTKACGWREHTPVFPFLSGGPLSQPAGLPCLPPACRFPEGKGFEVKVENCYGHISNPHAPASQLTACKVSVSSLRLLRHFAAAILFRSLLIRFFSSSSGVSCSTPKDGLDQPATSPQSSS